MTDITRRLRAPPQREPRSSLSRASDSFRSLKRSAVHLCLDPRVTLASNTTPTRELEVDPFYPLKLYSAGARDLWDRSPQRIYILDPWKGVLLQPHQSSYQTVLVTNSLAASWQKNKMATPSPSHSFYSSSSVAAATATITVTTPSSRSSDVNPPISSPICCLLQLQEVLRAGASYTTTERYLIDARHADYVKGLFDKMQGASKYAIKAKPSRDNIDFVTPPVTPHIYPVSNRTRAHVNSAFSKFSKRFCSKFYIPDDVSMCISLLFNGMDRQRGNRYLHENFGGQDCEASLVVRLERQRQSLHHTSVILLLARPQRYQLWLR